MLTQENVKKLESAIIDRLNKMDTSTGVNDFAKAVANVAAKVSVLALIEYEKLNQAEE